MRRYPGVSQIDILVYQQHPCQIQDFILIFDSGLSDCFLFQDLLCHLKFIRIPQLILHILRKFQFRSFFYPFRHQSQICGNLFGRKIRDGQIAFPDHLQHFMPDILIKVRFKKISELIHRIKQLDVMVLETENFHHGTADFLLFPEYAQAFAGNGLRFDMVRFQEF